MNGYMLGILILGLLVGFGLAYWVKGYLDRQKVKAANDHAHRIHQDAKQRADALLKEASLEAKDRLLKMKSEFDGETKETRSELKKREHRLIQKEENIDRKRTHFHFDG